ncbi:DUF4862 family protein [Microbacterium sp. NPDC087591]|jgi:hypothetical protein|uniref:DUF4862 family protein n=1 Tax=Microbacterium sp. NPDC087591 TaxID=3364192 RepID=UPI003821AE48
MTGGDVVVGAYAALSAADGPDVAAAFVRAVLAVDGVDGLEIPLGLASDPSWFEWAVEGRGHVVTAVPVLAVRTRAESEFGLASKDRRGRRDAVRVVSRLRDAIAHWRGEGRDITTLALSSGVPGGDGADARLGESLSEIRSWEWGGVRIAVEHCDAHIGAGTPDKGYLRLEDELAAISRSDGAGDAVCGITINWGRSAIESRDPSGAAAHVDMAGDRLIGYMLSGVASEAGPYGPAWTDSHTPVVDAADPAVSILTRERAAQAITPAVLRAAYRGVKTSWRPAGEDISTRVAALQTAVDLLTPASTKGNT